MNDLPIYTFPNRETIQTALNAANDDRWLQERLFPAIAKKFEGQKLVEPGIDLRFEMLMYDLSKTDESDAMAYRTLRVIGTLDEIKNTLKGVASF